MNTTDLKMEISKLEQARQSAEMLNFSPAFLALYDAEIDKLKKQQVVCQVCRQTDCSVGPFVKI